MSLQTPTTIRTLQRKLYREAKTVYVPGCRATPDIAGAESLYSLEGNMCGAAMRGADALPGSKATSRAKGSHRKLGGLGSDRNGTPVVARIGKVRSRSR